MCAGNPVSPSRETTPFAMIGGPASPRLPGPGLTFRKRNDVEKQTWLSIDEPSCSDGPCYKPAA